MKYKWYRSNVTKTILVIAEHICALLLIAAILCGIAYPHMVEEIVTRTASYPYEDSEVFDETMQNYSAYAVNNIWIRETLETDGKYDAKKIVDVQRFRERRTVSGKDETGLSFYLEDVRISGLFTIQIFLKQFHW